MSKLNSKKQPFVSVILPVYNGEKYISLAIDSILRQTYSKFELIIVNDCSTDSTKGIIESYQQRFPAKIKLIHLPKRQGAYAAMNRAMKICRGELIAPMDSDDVAHSERLKKEVNFLTANPEVIVVGSWARIINQDGEVIGAKAFKTTHKEIYQLFFTVHPMVHPVCMIRRKMLLNNKRLYHNSFGVNDDYYTFFNLLNRGKFANIPEYLLDYRIHETNSSLKNLKASFFNTVKIRLAAVNNLGYKADLVGLVKLLLQVLFVILIPEKILLNIYLYIKGVHQISDPINFNWDFRQLLRITALRLALREAKP